MFTLGRALWGVLFPLSAPLGERSTPSDHTERVWWALTCLFAIIPLTAQLHHGIFYRPRCMLNDFGPDYTLDVVARWIARDPSLAWAMVYAGLLYWLGERFWLARLAAAPFFIAWVPFSLWIWDIPFTGRIICEWGHDKRPLVGGFVMRTAYLYIFCALLQALLVVVLAIHGAHGRQRFKPS
jgi:hypothetical protein